jgi:hypothetical protein
MVSLPTFAPSLVIVCLVLALAYRLLVIILVRSSKYDMEYRDRWMGLWVQRGADSGPVRANRRRRLPRPTCKAGDDPTPDEGAG